MVEDGTCRDDGPGDNNGVCVNEGTGEYKSGIFDAGGGADVGRGMDKRRAMSSDGIESVEECFANGKVADGNGYGRIGGGNAFKLRKGGNSNGRNVVQIIGGRIAAVRSELSHGEGVGAGAED